MSDMVLRRLGIAELEERLAVDRKTVSRWVRAGRFPAPHYLGELRRWWLHEVVAWEEKEMAPDRPRARSAPRAE